MKTEEDEAFDDLARRQGAWGGGFKAKQAMAADKLQEDLINYGTSWSQDGKRIDPMSVYKEQPAQEPVAVVDVHEFYDNCANFSFLQKLPEGKHTLYTTPPQPAQRPWVGLTDEDIEGCSHHVDDEAVIGLSDFARAVEQLLKEKNNGT